MTSWDKFFDGLRLPSGVKLVPFFYGHVSMMNLNEHDQATKLAVPDWMARLRSQAELGPCFTGIYYGKPVVSFGIIHIWPGLSEAWMIPDRDIGCIAIPLCRVARQFFNHCETTMGLRRIQILVRSSNVRAVKWAEFLYFDHEATLTAFGPDGEDYLMMRRLSNEQSIHKQTTSS